MRDTLAFLTDNLVNGITTASRFDKVTMFDVVDTIAKGGEITEEMRTRCAGAAERLRKHLPNAGYAPVGSTPLSRPSPVAA